MGPGEAPIPKGRLASKKEGAGKIRIFALANPLLQGMVRPIHDWLMTILSLIRSDGTLNQLRPLSFIRHRLEYYSFDWKAATDSMPAGLTEWLVGAIFGYDFAAAWMTWSLRWLGFQLPYKGASPAIYGQKAGYYRARKDRGNVKCSRSAWDARDLFISSRFLAGKIKWIKQHLLACLQMPSLCLSLASFLFCLVLVSLSSLVCLSECWAHSLVFFFFF